MHVIFLGLPLPADSINEQDPKVHVAKVGSLAQIGLLRAIRQDKHTTLTTITASPTGRRTEIDLGGGIRAYGAPNLRTTSFGLFLLSLTMPYVLALFSALRGTRRERRPVIIITLGTAIPFSLPVLIARRFFSDIVWCPFLVDAVETPHYGSLPFRIASRVGVWAARQADAAITYSVPTAVHYLPNRPYLELLFGVNDEDMARYQSPSATSDRFTIAYVGALTPIYNFRAIVEVIRRTGREFHWVFAGYGPHEHEVQNLATDDRYDVDYLGVVPRADAIATQKAADLLLCLRLSAGSDVNRYSAIYQPSGKITEYLCAGKPVLSNDIPATSPQLKPFLVFADSDSAADIERAIRDIRDHYAERLETARRGQEFAFTVCRNSHQATQINAFLASLSAGGRGSARVD